MEKVKKVLENICYKVLSKKIMYHNIITVELFILVFFEIYGCQMNINDADIIWSILKSHNYKHTKQLDEADIVLLVTCSIRDNAEQKVWNKLEFLNGIKKRRRKISELPMKIGLLGKFYLIVPSIILSIKYNT